MARYIDADKLIGQMLLEKSAYENRLSVMKDENMRNMTIEIECRSSIDELGRCVNMVEQSPAADVESVKHGEWILDKKITSPIFLNCSLCGNTADKDIHGNYIGITPYCSMCGAKMDGGNK